MKNLVRKLWKDEGGFVVSVELILIVTILVIGLVSGWTMLRDAVLAELADTANAIGATDQSFEVSGVTYGAAGSGASSAHFGWSDAKDTADSSTGIGLAVDTGLTVVVNTNNAADNVNETGP
ncbi:Flp family type IVb pilin [Anatilimnocola floriformis]|uniref:Flp family type IVb pilin n=1 Tax=Anatilimnocola floriformis TaxID=2948575 RepID=UPI0020C20F03|nr:hypothetical protein [Anatilimnocola floriformis]